MSDLDYLPILLTEMVENYGKDIRLAVVSELESEEAIFVEDGNHGEYRPQSHEFVSEGIPFVRPPNLIHGRIDFKECQKINQTAFDRVRKGIGKGGDIVLTHNATIGRIAITSPDVPIFVTNPQTTVWRSLNPRIIDQKFLYYFMSSRGFQEQLHMHIGRNSTFDYVSLTLQRSFVIPILPLQIQKVIAHILDTLDGKIENLRRQNKTLEAIAQTLFKHWFFDFEFPNKDGKPYKSSGGAVERSNLDEVPAGWHIGKLNELITVNPTESIKKGAFVKYVDMKSLSTSSMEITDFIVREFTSGSKFRNNDILMARITPCLENGKTAFVNILNEDEVAYGSTEFIVMRANANCCPEYVYCLSRSLSFRNYAIKNMTGSSGRQRVSDDRIENYKLVVPNSAVLQLFHSTCNPLFLKSKSNQQQVQTLSKIRDVLLPLLMSGKLRIAK